MGLHAPEMMVKIRLRVADMQKTRYSDYEVLSALNDARTMLWIALAENFSSIPRKRADLTLDEEGKARLPGDYYSLVGISPGARVDGFFITGAPGDTVCLEYNGLPLPSGDLGYVSRDVPLFEFTDTPDGATLVYSGDYFPNEEDGDLNTTPFSLALDIVEMAASILGGAVDAAAQIAKNTAARVTRKREHARFKDRRPIP